MITSVPCFTTAKTLDCQWHPSPHPCLPTPLFLSCFHILHSGWRYSLALWNMICSCYLFFPTVSLCCCLFRMPAKGYSAYPPSLPDSFMLSSSIPPAEVGGWWIWMLGLPRSAQPSTQCLGASLPHSYSIPSWGPNTCSLNELPVTKAGRISLPFLFFLR